jgi:hypothetical protein
MPKVKIDYQNTIIYKIVCNDLAITDCYVGHTINFIKRKWAHKSSCTNENGNYNLKIYKTIRDNGGWDNWSMIEIEKYACNDKNEALARERYWLEELNAKMNIVVPSRTIKEYYEVNKEKMIKYNKEYRELNKDKIKDYQKNYHKNYYEVNRDKKREYYEANSEKIIERSKTYYEVNSEKIKKQNNEKIYCNFCQCQIARNYLARHQKTTKCLEIQSELVLA